MGPGIIILGASIGTGEFLLGPAVVLRHGFSLLWIAGLAIFLQTIFNTELMRYTLATGEPAVTGFMRTRPGPIPWAAWYVFLMLLQFGWPAWAGTAAGALFFLITKELPGPGDANLVYLLAFLSYGLSVGILLVGRRIERTLEILNWVMVSVVLAGLLVLALMFTPLDNWIALGAGFVGYDAGAGGFAPLPEGADWFLIGAFAAFAGAGGMGNVTLSNWARDKGYGMARVTGFIPAAMGARSELAATGAVFEPTPEAMQRWKGWWRIVRADQYGVFLIGALIGMSLPPLLYVVFVEGGQDIRGLGIAAQLAHGIAAARGPLFGGAVALLGFWILFKTQLDLLEAVVRLVTDTVWTASPRVRRWRGGDVRAVYYTVLAITVIWGLVALRLAQPIVLIQIAANVGGLIFVWAGLHLLRVNTRLLPPALRPPLWRRLALVALVLFYGSFTALWLGSLL